MSKLIKTISFAKQNKEIDVRAILSIQYSKNKETIICIDAFDNLLVNGNLILPNKGIVDFINHQLKWGNK